MDNEEAKYKNPIAEPEHKDVIEMSEEDRKFLSDVEWQSAAIDDNWLDPSEQYIRPRYTLSYNGVPFAPLGGIHGLTGQPGHGKTFTFTQLMVAILKGEFYGLKYELSRDIPEPKVLYIDTEMEKGNTQLVMLRVYEMMGWPTGSEQEQFKILWLREVTKSEDRWKKTLKAIYDMKPTVVFLDGLIDVIADFNDNKECQTLIYQCMSAASHYGISMWLLLHENPGSEKMVGHAGSFLERKATDVLKTKKEKGTEVIFNVEQKKARSRDLDKWQFKVDDDEHHYGIPHLLVPETPSTKPAEKDETEDQQIVQNVLAVIGTDKKVSFTALRERIKKEHGIGSTKAANFITAGVKFGILTISDNTYTANPEDLYEKPENKLPF